MMFETDGGGAPKACHCCDSEESSSLSMIAATTETRLANQAAKLEALRNGLVIPACPLALDSRRRFDERRQRALLRYYSAAGAGGVAVGVHTTQFEIREPSINLFQPLLQLASEEMQQLDEARSQPLFRVGGVCGRLPQALREAQLLADHQFDAALVSLAALPRDSEAELIEHCRQVAQVLPIIGFYLQPAVGGRILTYEFWEQLCEIEQLIAIKIAPFNRYQTLDVVRAVIQSGRDDVALYTGNDDHIVLDLLTPHRYTVDDEVRERWIVGGLLGQWAVWTRAAVEMLDRIHELRSKGGPVPLSWLTLASELTDANSACFDATHGFAGCVAGLHEVLRRQGLLEGVWLLDPDARLSPGQAAELDRVCEAYPHLTDDAFIQQHLDDWLR